MILCGIFLTQGSSVMLWRHLKQTPNLDLLNNSSSLFSNQWGDQILSRYFPHFFQFYFSHKISLTNPNQNWICKSQPSTKNNPHIHQISYLQNPVIIDLLFLFQPLYKTLILQMIIHNIRLYKPLTFTPNRDTI